MQVYNETLRDLLQPGQALPLREDGDKGSQVVGLSVHKPKVCVCVCVFACVSVLVIMCACVCVFMSLRSILLVFAYG